MPGGLTEAPAPAVAVTYLRSRSRLLTLLGGDPERISGRLVAPYPRLLLLPVPAAGLAVNGWLSEQAVQVAGVGSADYAPSSMELWQLCAVALEELLALPNIQVTDPAAPVVHWVSVSGPSPVPDQGGHPRFVGTATMRLHPGPASVP